MTTAQQIIDSSARQAGILAEGQTLETYITTDALNRLNRMIARFKNKGVDLGLATLAAGDTINIDVADEEALELQLTARLMVRYKRPFPPGFAQAVGEAFIELSAKYRALPEMGIDSAITRRAVNTFVIS